VLKPIVELYHLKYENVDFLRKYFVDVDGPYYVCKMVEVHHKRKDQLHH
jgi:hypothetical protein